VTTNASATYDDAGRTTTRTIDGDKQTFTYSSEGLLTSTSGFGCRSPHRCQRGTS
jgi:YD repeat-containing protein